MARSTETPSRDVSPVVPGGSGRCAIYQSNFAPVTRSSRNPFNSFLYFSPQNVCERRQNLISLSLQPYFQMLHGGALHYYIVFGELFFLYICTCVIPCSTKNSPYWIEKMTQKPWYEPNLVASHEVKPACEYNQIRIWAVPSFHSHSIPQRATAPVNCPRSWRRHTKPPPAR